MKPFSALVMLIVVLVACGSDNTESDHPRPACPLTCTSFSVNGSCYCQTTCTGQTQIFTCDNGACTCQGHRANPSQVNIACVSQQAADSIYRACFP
ncbi:hypothetical protein LZC95_48620 [Pendulispora brunnea]|uniref:Extracellular membrane protein CFEM domain-containing protein n=1 Tax=Pendulispora brunnea TaxID=2905690 RepID=A0ABZ2KAA1_9BACT